VLENASARQRAALVPPSRWLVPRARARYWPRLDGGSDCDVEAEAVRRYAAITTAIARALPFEVGQRRLADLAGLPASVVEAALAGRAWASLSTLGRIACVLGLRLVLAGNHPPVHLDDHRPSLGRPPDRPGVETAALAAAGLLPAGGQFMRLGLAGCHDEAVCRSMADVLAPAWHNVITAELWWRLRYQRLTAAAAADELGVRPNTISSARRAVAPDRWVSTRLVAGLAYLLDCHLEVRPDVHPWPKAPWQC